MRYSIYLLTWLLSLSTYSSGQITVGPEIGISAFPFEILGRPDYKSGNFAISYGLFGIIPVTKSTNVKLSISYADRKDICIGNGSFTGQNRKTFYSNSDLNLDLLFSYKWNERILSGIGVSTVYKLNSWAGTGEYCNPNSILIKYDMSHMQYALSASVEYLLKNLHIGFQFSRFLKVEYLENFYVSGKFGKNRYDLRVAYPIRLWSKKQ